MPVKQNRWLTSRWLMISVGCIALSAFFVIMYPETRFEALDVFGLVTGIALGGGHITNGIRQSRGHPTVQYPAVEPDECALGAPVRPWGTGV